MHESLIYLQLESMRARVVKRRTNSVAQHKLFFFNFLPSNT